MFARAARYIGVKSQLSEDKLPGLEEIVGDPIVVRQIYDAARSSMGAYLFSAFFFFV
jgi:nucleolar protein 56